MLKISRHDKKLTRLEPQSLEQAGILEKYDLQEYLFNSPQPFFDEIEEEYLEIVGKEVKPSTTVNDRIDLLAIDEEGNGVILELKRGHDKLQLVQAIGYAAMISKWEAEDFEKAAGQERWEKIRNFLKDWDTEGQSLNQTQRIILIAESYHFEVLAAAEWLCETYAVDIKCFVAELALDKTISPHAEYLAFTQVYPARGIDEIAVTRTRLKSGYTASASTEFLNVIEAYNAHAPQDIRAVGTAPRYRIIHPADWPSKQFLQYEFVRAKGGFAVHLLIRQDRQTSYADLLKPLAGTKLSHSQAALEWDEQYRWGNRLLTRFPQTTPADLVADGMRDLIGLTRPMGH